MGGKSDPIQSLPFEWPEGSTQEETLAEFKDLSSIFQSCIALVATLTVAETMHCQCEELVPTMLASVWSDQRDVAPDVDQLLPGSSSFMGRPMKKSG